LFEAGNVAELANALCSLAGSASRCRQIGLEAASFVRENLTIDVAASRLAGIYKELLAKKTGNSIDIQSRSLDTHSADNEGVKSFRASSSC
jgi:hypothetical protein